MGAMTGKIIWVTGAGTGIGAATAARLARDGAVVLLSGRRRDPLEAVRDGIAAAGGTAHVRQADASRATDVDAAMDWIGTTFGRLDILVSNAGLNIQDRAWDRLTPAGIDQLIDGNLRSAFLCARAVLPMMRAQRDGVLVHTASMAGRQVSPMAGPGYTAVKHAVVAMSHGINMEECANGIRSTAFCPGEVNTPILQQRPNPLSAEDLARMLQPADCADLIAYVCGLPPHVCLNEVWLTPTHNRGYLAATQRRL